MDDKQLLSCYVADRSDETAFGELVRRHIGFVYRSALRRLAGDTHLAEDVSQVVFITLARDAARVRDGSLLVGWLHGTTRRAAAQAVRTEQRRRQRETELMKMHDTETAGPGPAPGEITLALDRALDALGTADRQALLLRFFEQAPFGEIALRLGISEDAARMRVERALDRLRRWFTRRGLASSTAALGAAMSAEAGFGAPAGLAGTVTAASLGQAASVGAGATLLGIMTTTKLGVAALAVIALAAGAGLDEWMGRQAPPVPLSAGRAITEVTAAKSQPPGPQPANGQSTTEPAKPGTEASPAVLPAVLAEPDPDRRRIAVAGLLAAAGESDLRELLRQLAAESSTARRDEIVAAVFRRWGGLNPAGAFAAIVELSPQRSDVPRWNQAILAGWAENDLEGPIRWVRRHSGNYPEADRDGDAGVLVHAIAESALNLDRPEVVRAAALAPREDAAGGPWVTRFLYALLADYYARYDLPAATALVSKVPAGAPERQAIVDSLAQSLARESPDVAARFAFALPGSTPEERSERLSTIETTFNALGNAIDPGQAEAWIAQQAPGPDLDVALAGMIPGLAIRDSAAAARALKAISSLPQRGTSVLEAAGRLRSTASFREALDFAAANYPAGADREGTLRSLANSLASFHGGKLVADDVRTMTGLSGVERDSMLQAQNLRNN